MNDQNAVPKKLLRLLAIRQAQPSDLDALVEIERLSFATPWTPESLSAELNGESRSVVLVAEMAGRGVIGYIGCWFVLDDGQINNIAVHPDCRHTGVGSALLSALLKFGLEKGIARYTLEVRPSNVEARRLYERFGFSAVGQRKNYYEDNSENAIIMLKNMDQPN